ncbi:MAG: GspE/PulE family protein [Phycisphaerales bacterium]
MAIQLDEGTRALARFDALSFLDWLASRGKVTQSDVQLARGIAAEREQSLLAALLDLGVIAEESLADALAEATGAPRWSDESDERDGEGGGGGVSIEDLVDQVLPVAFMRSAHVVVLRRADAGGDDAQGSGDDGSRPALNAGAAPGVGAGGAVRVVVADPSDPAGWHAALMRLHAQGVGFVAEVGTHKSIAAMFERLDREAAEHEGGAEEGAAALSGAELAGELAALRDMASEAPVIRLFNQIVERAMDLSASDIHLERFDGRVSLRYRVDGMLIEQPSPAREMYDALLVRMKIMAGLDIAERRKAQDGRVRQRLRGRAVDLRVSMIPTMFGQDAAMRLQDRQKLAEIDLTELGFDQRHIDRLHSVAGKSHGILLITGPTGSGKTTTLYAMLRKLRAAERKIITVEDPIEYTMDGVNQMQANPAVGMGFANSLRHILRHDPDVILIGEIRDRETAEMAFQSALTGHMVLSTLHTNDVPSTFVRLIDMGVEPYLVNAAVEGVSAQRLLRRVCGACRNREPAREHCRQCGGLGYRGRVAAMEFSEMPGKVKQLLLEHAEESRIRAALDESGFESLGADARRLVRLGVTDAAEVARVMGAQALHAEERWAAAPDSPSLDETGGDIPKHRHATPWPSSDTRRGASDPDGSLGA